MSKNITEMLKEATNGILTPEVLTEIEALFNSAAEAKAKIHVESALIAQDEDYSKKLETLISAIDVDHVKKLNKVVEAIDNKRASQLKMVVEKYERHLGREAKNFKQNLIEKVSDYLSAYVDEKIPTETIEEAVKNRRAFDLLNDFRSKLGVDMALATETIREAVQDGKSQLDSLKEEVNTLREQNVQLTESNSINSAKLLVETKISDFPNDKKTRIRKMIEDKDAAYITENCEYIIKLVEKNEEAHLEVLKEEATKNTQAAKVDRQVINESTEESDNKPDHELTSVYMKELKKW